MGTMTGNLRKHALICALFVVLSVARGSRSADGPCIAVASTKKIRPTSPYWTPPAAAAAAEQHGARGGAGLTVRVARNEYESLQVVCNGPATIVSASVDALPSGVESLVHVVGYYNALNASDCDGSRGEWPDPLVPAVDPWFKETRNAFPVNASAGGNQALWVDLFVPPTAAAGVTQASVSVAWSAMDGTGGVQTQVVPFALSVWNFTLPSTLPVTTEFGFRSRGALGEADPRAPRAAPSETDATVAFQQLALMHRVTLGGFMANSGLPALANATDPSSIDWSGFDSVWGAALNESGMELPFGLRGARVTSAQLAVPFTGDFVNASSELQQKQVEYWAAVASHFEQLGPDGVKLLYDYGPDEPHTPQAFAAIAARGAALHRAHPDLEEMITTEWHKAVEYNLTTLIDRWCPIINFIDVKAGDCYPYAGDLRSLYDSPDVKTLWWYQSCMSDGCAPAVCNACEMGWPSYMIDHPAVRNRIMPWMTYRYNISGELYWGSNAATSAGTDAAWTAEGLFVAGGNGDGTLTYPGTVDRVGGTHPIPIASLRLKQVRDGQEDWAYLAALEKLTGSRSASMEHVAAVAASAYSFTTDAAVFEVARTALGDAVEAAAKASGVDYVL